MSVQVEVDGDGVISDDDVDAWLAVVKGAFDVHVDRERIRRGLWKEYPAKDQAGMIKVKIDRVLRTLERSNLTDAEKANVLEEVHDIINYATFTARTL